MAVLALPILFSLARIVPPIIRHDFALNRFKASFQRIPHPADTTQLASFSSIGVFHGNGNHCDYMVGEVRETDGSPDSVLQHYRKIELPHVFPAPADMQEKLRITIEFEDEFDREEGVDFSYPLSKAMAQAKARRTKRTLYLVNVVDAGYDPEGDLSCH